MDSRKIVEVLRATLDANQQQQAHEQLQQVRKSDENRGYKFSRLKHMGWDIFALKVYIFFVCFPLHCAPYPACNPQTRYVR